MEQPPDKRDPAAAADLEKLRLELARTRRDEERCRAIVEAAPDAILMTDSDGRILLVNGQVEHVFGYRRRDLIGRPIEILIPERYRHRHARDRTAYVHEPRTRPMGVGLDLYGRRKDGSEFPVEVSLSPLGTADGVVVISVIRDISERRQAEERLRHEEAKRRTEERFRLLLENVTDIVAVLDADLRFDYASAAVGPVLGHDPKSLHGHPLADYAHPDDVARMADLLARGSAKPPVATSFELRFRHRDGTWRSLEAVANDLRGHPGVGGLVLTLRDVTDRKRLEAQLLQTQKMESVGRLAGGVAHDFNNLLTGILSYAELALESTPEGSPVRDHLEVIARAGEQAAALTRQLLVFSRRQVNDVRQVDVNGLIANVEKLLRRLIGETIELRTFLNPDVGLVRVDAGQIEQVILNLAVNARDAMSDGGRLIIESTVSHLEEPYLRQHPGVEPGEYVVISVTDTGVGMTDEVKAHLFEPFFTTKEQGKGTGLGLATCYAIVRQSGGHITVYSEIGQGTTVRVFLPRVAGTGEPLGPSQARAASPGGTETILVVEDEGTLRDLVVRVLSDLGYKVLHAATGLEALDLLRVRQEPIDLVLTDVVMPGLGGPALAERLRELRPGTRVLFMSGYAANAAVFQGGINGDLLLLNKPFTPRLLARKVREVLDRDR